MRERYKQKRELLWSLHFSKRGQKVTKKTLKTWTTLMRVLKVKIKQERGIKKVLKSCFCGVAREGLTERCCLSEDRSVEG